jgi:hypothetical protein
MGYPQPIQNEGGSGGLVLGLALTTVAIAGAGVGAYFLLKGNSSSSSTKKTMDVPNQQQPSQGYGQQSGLSPDGGNGQQSSQFPDDAYGQQSSQYPDSGQTTVAMSGALKHISGKCVHPLGWFNDKSQDQNNPDNGTPAVLFDGCGDRKNQFEITASGSIKHIPSGKCFHPAGWFDGKGNDQMNPRNDTPLVLWGSCDEAKTEFKMLDNGAIQHKPSGKCVHPSGWFDGKGNDQMNPRNDTPLVLYDGCDDPKNKFSWQK